VFVKKVPTHFKNNGNDDNYKNILKNLQRMKMFFALEEKNSRRTGSSYYRMDIEDKRIGLFESHYH